MKARLIVAAAGIPVLCFVIIYLPLWVLGFVVGATVTVVNSINGNLIITVMDSRVALDKSMAARIMVS